MLFRSTVALLLVFSLASINASSLNRRQVEPAPGGPRQVTEPDGEKFAKVLACAVPKVDLKAPAGQDGSNAIMIAFDECAVPIYSSSSCGSSAKPDGKNFEKVLDCAVKKINEKPPQGKEPVAAVIAFDGCAQTIYSTCTPAS